MAQRIEELERVIEKLEPQQFLTFRLNRAHAKLNAQANHILGRHAGISLVQWRIIALLGSDTANTLTELITLVDADKGQFSRRVKTLLDLGLVAARQNPSDRRQQILRLTPKGRKLYDDTIEVMRKRQRLLINSLSGQELEVFYQALDKLSAAANHRDI